MNKKVLLTVAAVTVIGAGVFTSRALAEGETNTNPVSALVEKIATKFGLNKDEVQTVFDQYRDERQAERQKEYEARLDQFVKDGKITEAQKQLIVAKHKEFAENRQKTMESMRNMTLEERKATMDKERQAMEDWAKQNGIDVQYVMMFGGRGMGGHRAEFGGGDGMGMGRGGRGFGAQYPSTGAK